MAQVNIFEMGELNGMRNVMRVPFINQQALTSSPSSAFKGGTRFIVVQTDTLIYINITPNGSAATTVTDFKVPAGEERSFEVQPGHKLAWTT